MIKHVYDKFNIVFYLYFITTFNMFNEFTHSLSSKNKQSNVKTLIMISFWVVGGGN